MRKKRLINQCGFTLVELIIGIVISLIVILVVGVMLADGHRAWNVMYSRTYADVVTDGYVARRKFDAVMRKASGVSFLLGDAGDWVEVYYYQDVDSPLVDRYARFYVSDGSLNIEYGQLDAYGIKTALTTQTVCGNVSGCVFRRAGKSAQMTLTLDNGTQTNTPQ